MGGGHFYGSFHKHVFAQDGVLMRSSEGVPVLAGIDCRGDGAYALG